MVDKIFGIFKLPHSFNFCDITATFIVIYCMAFTENLFYSTCYYSYWLFILQLHREAAATGQLHCTRHRKWCSLFPQTSSQASIQHDQPHCTVQMEILTFFWECHVHMNYIRASHTRRDWTTKSSSVCNFCLFTTGPQNPVIPVYFLFYSWWCYKVTCTMSNVGCLLKTEERKEKYPTGSSIFGQGKQCIKSCLINTVKKFKKKSNLYNTV